jgi:hypothetical protein
VSSRAEKYSPTWAPHVAGEYERDTDPETGRPEPTWVRLSCGMCGESHRVRCDSGAPRNWVLKWAVLHAHRDPLKPSKEKKA